MAGAAWVVAALLIGFLAIEQLSAAGTVARLQAYAQSVGVAYTGVSQSDLQASALWNAAVAVLTGYAAIRMFRDPSDRILRLSVTWAVIHVLLGTIQVANGVSATAFLAATVVMAAAGVASFAALQEGASRPDAVVPTSQNPPSHETVTPAMSSPVNLGIRDLASRLPWLVGGHPVVTAVVVIVVGLFLWAVALGILRSLGVLA